MHIGARRQRGIGRQSLGNVAIRPVHILIFLEEPRSVWSARSQAAGRGRELGRDSFVRSSGRCRASSRHAEVLALSGRGRGSRSQSRRPNFEVMLGLQAGVERDGTAASSCSSGDYVTRDKYGVDECGGYAIPGSTMACATTTVKVPILQYAPFACFDECGGYVIFRSIIACWAPPLRVPILQYAPLVCFDECGGM